MEKLYLVGRNVAGFRNPLQVQVQEVDIIKETKNTYIVNANAEYRRVVRKSELRMVNNNQRVFAKTLEEGLEAYKNYCEFELYTANQIAKDFMKRLDSIEKYNK